MRSSAISDALCAATPNVLDLAEMTRRFCVRIASRMDIAFRPLRNFVREPLDADLFEADRDDFFLPRTGLICFADDISESIIPQKKTGGFSEERLEAY
jgi:hypothetical protein